MDNTAKANDRYFQEEKKTWTYKFKTKFTSRDTEDYKTWLSFYPHRSYFKFQLDSYSYFDPRPMIISNITSVIVLFILLISVLTLSITWFHLLLIPFIFYGWGDFYLRLPFDTGMTDECENPSYGFYMYHEDPAPAKLNFPTCFIWQWNSYNNIEMPWSNTWVRTSILLKDGSWEHETEGNRKDFYEDEWEKKRYVVDYMYKDKSDDTLVPTKVYVEEREWRPIWFKWTSIFKYVSKSIKVEFSEEVGSKKGSWKGGVLGCGYKMNKNETALECIQRMEVERDFR